MTEQTLQQEVEGVQRRKNSQLRRNLTIVDVPMALAERFCYGIREEYGDVYWVKLQDLMRKAEAYDALLTFGCPAGSQQEEIQHDTPQETIPLTMDGSIQVTKK